MSNAHGVEAASEDCSVDPVLDFVRTAEQHLASRELHAAAVAFDAAASAGADPDRCAAGQWMVAMLAGHFELAWQQSDAIRRRGAADPHRFWTGAPIAGKRIIVRCLHGLGDSVQMLRYLTLLQQCCAAVTVELPPRLLPLASRFRSMGHAISWDTEEPQPAWDLQVEVMELPYLFRTTANDLPLEQGYLVPPAPLVREVSVAMGLKRLPRVGVVWSASEWDPSRVLPWDCLERILATPAVEFWDLQGGEQHALGRTVPALARTRDAAVLGEGVLPLAAVIANLDLLLTVDTLAAHLAGAAGKQAWVLLQARADWRWMHERDDSPWYPALRLWRQTVQDDWDTLTTRVCNALAAWTKERSA